MPTQRGMLRGMIAKMPAPGVIRGGDRFSQKIVLD
jgi:hypothetical protein